MPLELGKENPHETSAQMLWEKSWFGKAFVLWLGHPGPSVPSMFTYSV